MESKPRQSIHSSFLFLALFISTLLLITISINTRYLEPIEDVARRIAEPIVFLAHGPQIIVNNTLAFFDSRMELQSQNLELQRQVGRLNGIVAERDFMRKQVTELKEALGYFDPSRGKQFLAEVIRVDPNQQRLEVVINLGAEDGVTLNSVVLDPYGVYGRTIEVFKHTSNVMLISDERHALPVLLPRTNEYFIASGNGQDRPLTLDHVNLSADIQVGDKLVTSGLGGVFPAGYNVGSVVAVSDIVAEAAKSVAVALDSQAHKKSFLRVLAAVNTP